MLDTLLREILGDAYPQNDVRAQTRKPILLYFSSIFFSIAFFVSAVGVALFDLQLVNQLVLATIALGFFLVVLLPQLTQSLWYAKLFFLCTVIGAPIALTHYFQQNLSPIIIWYSIGVIMVAATYGKTLGGIDSASLYDESLVNRLREALYHSLERVCIERE